VVHGVGRRKEKKMCPNHSRGCYHDIAHTVDLIPVFGAQKDPQITANNTLEYPTDFYLNNFSDKEVYQSVLREFT
jgi:hypothetical protein